MEQAPDPHPTTHRHTHTHTQVLGGAWQAATSTAEDVPMSEYPPDESAMHLVALFRVVLRDHFGNVATWHRWGGGVAPVVTMVAAETEAHAAVVAAEWSDPGAAAAAAAAAVEGPWGDAESDPYPRMTFLCTLTSRVARNWTLSFSADNSTVHALNPSLRFCPSPALHSIVRHCRYTLHLLGTTRSSLQLTDHHRPGRSATSSCTLRHCRALLS